MGVITELRLNKVSHPLSNFSVSPKAKFLKGTSLLRDERVHFGDACEESQHSTRKKMLYKIKLGVSAIIILSLLQILTVGLRVQSCAVPVLKNYNNHDIVHILLIQTTMWQSPKD